MHGYILIVLVLVPISSLLATDLLEHFLRVLSFLSARIFSDNGFKEILCLLVLAVCVVVLGLFEKLIDFDLTYDPPPLGGESAERTL